MIPGPWSAHSRYRAQRLNGMRITVACVGDLMETRQDRINRADSGLAILGCFLAIM
jgi:hypothetical protein